MAGLKTVFILGAGASYEFGLPVGDTLKEDISKLFRFKIEYNSFKAGDGLMFDALQRADFEMGRTQLNELLNAGRSIEQALPLALSIDNFLHNHNGDEHVELCGKIGIVRSILSAESKSHMFMSPEANMFPFPACSKTWIGRFVQLLTEQCNLEQLPERLSSLVFIIFNYDRCIEHFLINALMVSYRISQARAGELVSGMAIYHPYGIVGNLPWMPSRGIEEIGFGGRPDAFNLVKLAREIKTFTEGTQDDSSDILAIRQSVVDADRFVFLGFAYHPLNMKLLLGESQKSNRTRRVFGTSFGMSNTDTLDVRDMLDSRLFAPSAAVRNDLKCYDLFHEFSRTLGFN